MTDKCAEQDRKNTIRTALLNTIANTFSLIIGMVMIPVIARVLSPADLGVATTFLANRNILVVFVTLSAYAYVNKAMLEFSEDRKGYMFSITFFCVFMVMLSFAVTVPFKEILMKILSLNEFLYYWLFISILSYALYSIANYYCIFHNYSLIVFIIVISCGPISQFLSVGLSYVFPEQKFVGRVIGLDAVYVITSLILLASVLLSGKKKFKKIYIARTLKFTIPVIPHVLSQMVLTQCDLIMISYFIGEMESGIYSMGHTVGFLAYTVMAQIMAAWSPWVYRRLEENAYETVRQNSVLIIVLGLYMAVGLLTVSPELIRIFLTDQYLPCVYIVPPLVLAMFFQFEDCFFYDLQYYNKKPRWIATASCIAAVLNLILNFIFIKKFGYLAAGYTTVTSYLIKFIINYQFSKRLQVESVYHVKGMFLCSFTVIVYMALMLFFTDHIITRYSLLLLITVLLICFGLKKKDIGELLKYINIYRREKQAENE